MTSFLEPLMGNITKLSRNDPWVVPYQNYLNGSD